MRTTLDIDGPILREVKAIHERDGRSMGAVVSDLLADALSRRKARRVPAQWRWTTQSMKPRVDLADKDRVFALLDQDDR